MHRVGTFQTLFIYFVLSSVCMSATKKRKLSIQLNLIYSNLCFRLNSKITRVPFVLLNTKHLWNIKVDSAVSERELFQVNSVCTLQLHPSALKVNLPCMQNLPCRIIILDLNRLRLIKSRVKRRLLNTTRKIK